MAEFYPSEIARLVLGYLKETKCLQSWEVFLEECTDLQEHKRLYRDGKFCTTNVNEKSLLDILSEYCVLKNASKESSQNQSSTNTYQVYGVYKTPSKNESSYASYSINQRIQTRSVVKSGVKSPRYNLFRSPTSRPSCQTARRKLECQATTLNFGPEAQTPFENNVSNNNANQSKQFLFISASSSTQTCSSSPRVSKDNLCLSSPGVPTCSNIQDRRDGPYSDPIRSKDVARINSENDDFFSPNQPETAEACSPGVINVSESDDREKCDTPDGTHSNISEFKVDKQKSSTTVMCNTAITQSSVRTAVSQSSEISASTETIALSLSENCSTPQYEADPPPYNRAPDTNSPRIVLSHDRSLIPSLTTPNKDKRSWPEEEWSPKRKGTIPRRRLISESPASKYIQQPETLITFDSVIENLFGPDEALFNDPLVQLLTENINKVKQCELKETDIECLDDLVKKAAESTGEDPAFERFLNQMCTNNKDGEHFNIESTPSKLAEFDYEMMSDENKNNQKEVTDKTVNDELNQETTQNFHNDTELELTKNPNEVADEAGCSNNESVNILENNLEPVVTDSDINRSISPSPQQVLVSDNNAQLNNTPENSSPENKTGESETVNKSNDLTSNLSANDNSDKDLQSAKVSSVISIDTSSIRAAVNDMLNNTNLNNPNEVKKAEISTKDNQNISVKAHNVPQTNNSCSGNSQSVSNIQMTGPNRKVTQVVNQPPQTAPLQPNALLEISVPTVPAILLSTLCPDGSVQSNLYRFVMNPPVFNPSPIGGIGLPLPTIPTQNVGTPLIVTSAPTVPLLNEKSGNNKTLPRAVENSIATPESSKSLILDIRSSDKEITPKKVSPSESSTPPKKRQRTSKRQKTKKGACEKPVSSPSLSGPKKSRKRYIKKDKTSKRKPLCLFPDSPSSKTNKVVFQTPVKDSENEIPVLSIPEPSPSNQSSAFKYLSQITGQFERGDRSPVLKSLMSQAAVLSDKKSRCTSSYVRCLDFSPDTNKINDSVNVTTNNKTVKPAVGKSNAASRRSSRIQRRKAEMLKDSKVVKSINVQQLKRKLNVDSVVVSSSTDHVKNVEPDNFNSPLFNKALDVLNCIAAAPVFDNDIDLEQIEPKENSHTVANLSSSDFLPSNQTIVAKKLEKNQQKDIEVMDLKESDNIVNLKDNISVLSTSPEKNISPISNLNKQHSKLREKQKVKNNANSKENKNINTSEKSPLQHKHNALSTVKSSSSFVPLPKCTNSEFFAKNSNDKSKEGISIINDSKNVKIVNESIISPESNKSNCTRLDLLLFGSDNEFTPEKDSNSCIQATNVPVSSSSIICASTATHIIEQNEVNQTTADTAIHALKNQNISPKVLSSLNSKQSPKCNKDELSLSKTVNSHLEEKFCNLIDKKYESASLLSSDNCLTINTSMDIQYDKKTKILNENTKKSELLTSLKVATTIQNADLVDIEKESYSSIEKPNVPSTETAALIQNRPVFKNKTPQKKSLESIVSFCKEKESAECQRVSKTPSKEGVTDEFGNFKKTLSEVSLQSNSKISPINNTYAHKSKDRTDCTQMIKKNKSSRKKSINNASHPPPTMQKSPNIQKNPAVSPENTPIHFTLRTKSVSPYEECVDMSKPNEHSLSALDNSKPSSVNEVNNFTCNKNQQLNNLSETANQKVKASVSASMRNSKNVVQSSIAASGTNNDLLAKKNTFSKEDIVQSNNSSENSKSANTETDKALPPPKKRIRPIPVDSSSNESYSSPFKRILNSPNYNMSACTISAENAAKKQVFIQSHLNVCEPISSLKLKGKSVETSNASITDFVPVCITDTSNLNDQSPIAKSSLTSFISPLKQPLKTNSPSLSIKTKSVSCSPKSMSPNPTFKQPFIWRSGKPRAMIEIYKNAFPHKNSELPISPLSFSNSSSTFDALPAKRKLLEDSPSESSKEIHSSESSKNLNEQENCDFNADLACNKKHTVQQKMDEENNALERQEVNSETPKTLRTYSRLRHVKKNASKISSDNTSNNGDDNNGDPFNKERKRKKSDSSFSDDCSTVVDFECDIMTPVKGDDWLKKDLFRKSPARSCEKSNKPRPTSVSSYESDISPEKIDYINDETGFSPYKLKEINMDIPLNSSTVNKLSQNLNENSPVNVSDTKLDSNIMDSSLNVCISNIDESIHEPDSVLTNKNIPKASTSAEIVEKHNEFENACSHSKKRRVSSDKKERRSRPTLKIASLNSPSKKKESDKKQDISPLTSNSKKSSIKKTVKKKTSPNVVPKNTEPREKSDKKNIRTSSRSHINNAKCTSEQNANLKKEITEKNANSLNQATKTVSEKAIKSCTATSQNSVISPKKFLGSLDHYETTQDIVESDIGRSSDAGSELSIAIASCERELLNSQSDNCSQSPRYHPDFHLNTPRKSPSNNQQVQHASPPKMDADGSKLNLIMDKINLLSPEKLNTLLEKIMKDKE